jgi:major membrane immunogen (membrane-anchored lipoprotein)
VKSAFSFVLSILLLAGCGFVEDMKGMMEKAQAVSKAIKDKHGWETQVGWNLNNGKLTDVTVMFQSKEVREQKVALLESAAAEAVGKTLALTPETLIVQIVSQPGT